MKCDVANYGNLKQELEDHRQERVQQMRTTRQVMYEFVKQNPDHTGAKEEGKRFDNSARKGLTP